MPFVPLSADGTQHVDTEPLPAPRVQVALAPHDSGVSVLLVEPDGGLRTIGQLDPVAAGEYGRALAPLAADGLLGTCTAETTGTGTVLWLAPAASCLPGPDVLAPPAGETDGTDGDTAAAVAETVRLPSTNAVEQTVRLQTAPTSIFAPGRAPAPAPPSGNPPAGRGSRRGAAPWVVGGLLAVLVAGGFAHGVGSGELPREVPLAAVGAAPTPVRPSATPSATPVPVPEPVAQPTPRAAAAPARSRTAAPAPAPTPDPPAEDDEHADEHSEEHSDAAESADHDSSSDEHSDRRPDSPSAPSGGSGGDREVRYRSCVEARLAGAAPIRRGEPGYRAGLDRDRDGVACEGR